MYKPRPNIDKTALDTKQAPRGLFATAELLVDGVCVIAP